MFHQCFIFSSRYLQYVVDVLISMVCARNKRVLIGMLSRVFEVLRIRVEMLLQSYQRSVGGDVTSIQPDSVPWCEYWGRLTSAVVVHGVLIFHLCKCRFCFLNSQCYAFREFIDRVKGTTRNLSPT
jgi:hypothetical protein